MVLNKNFNRSKEPASSQSRHSMNCSDDWTIFYKLHFSFGGFKVTVKVGGSHVACSQHCFMRIQDSILFLCFHAFFTLYFHILMFNFQFFMVSLFSSPIKRNEKAYCTIKYKCWDCFLYLPALSCWFTIFLTES